MSNHEFYMEISIRVMFLVNHFFLEMLKYFFSLLYAPLPHVTFTNFIRIYARCFSFGKENASILFQNHAFHFFLIFGKNCEVINCRIFQKEVCRVISIALIIDSVQMK